MGPFVVNDPLISRFAEDCGATAPLNLRVESNGGVLAEGTVHQPFTLIGRDDACDVTLTDPDVNLRHAWMQVIGGRTFLVDLGSRNGLVWPTGPRHNGWLDVGVPVGVGPFQLLLRSPASTHAATWPVGFNPLRADQDVHWPHPAVGLEFRNGRRPRDRWPVNRMITLVGRSPDCKIHLNADDIALYHCGLVLTTTGLWVVDLSGRGVVVDGERMRVAALKNASELWVGRFLIACIYTSLGPTPAISRPSPLSVTPTMPQKQTRTPPRETRIKGTTPGTNGLAVPAVTPQARGGSVAGLLSATSLLASAATMGEGNPKLANLLPEDEVPLGVQPIQDSSGLPSSHIMADAFESLKQALADRNSPNSAAGPISAAISLSGTMTPPPGESKAVSRPSQRSIAKAPTVPSFELPRTDSKPHAAAAPIETPPDGAPAAILLPMLKQLGDVHNQMFDQFQQSMMLMAQMFGQLHRDQMTLMQEELLRIQELNAELARLQSEVAHLTMVQALGLAAGGSKTLPSIPQVHEMWPGNGHISPAEMKSVAVARIQLLQDERQSRWNKLVISLSTPPKPPRS